VVKIEAPPVHKGFLANCIIYLSKVVDPLSSAGTAFAAALLAVMMFLIFFDVAGGGIGGFSFIQSHTSIFRPIVGSNEVTEFLMVMMVVFAIAYCAQKRGHIRVDLILQYVPRKANLWIDIFTYGFSCIFYIFIAWQGWRSAWDSIDSHVSSSVLLIPIYPFAFVMVIGAAVIVLIFLRDFLKSIQEVTK
jgi:TRAP-type C4-dicarboxylate transport system permease small subunit